MAQTTEKTIFQQKGLQKSHDILTCTIGEPPFSYAHLELVSYDTNTPLTIDNLQLKSYCTSALRQFLGITGAAISIDVLKVQGSHGWVRVPRAELGAFAAALTGWRGTSEDGVQVGLQLRQCADWLGAMVGTDGQDRLWNA